MNDKRRSEGMSFTLKVWRQRNAQARGKMTTHRITRIRPDMSFLEMLDIL